MPVDFSDKLRSTRADGKLVDAAAIDGVLDASQVPAGTGTGGTDYTWRPFFFVLSNVGPYPRAFHTCRLAPGVSRGTYDVAGNLAPRLILDVARYRNDGTYYGDGTNQQEDQSASRFAVSLTLTPPASLTSTQKLFVFWARTPATLPTTGADLNVDVIGPVEVLGNGGYTTTATHTVSQLHPLIQADFDGKTGTTTSEVQVAGLTIENSANVGYLIRVRSDTHYILGNALHAVRSNDPIEVGIANLYSKGGGDAGKLYHTLDEATDDVLEVWKINDLATLEPIIQEVAGDDDMVGLPDAQASDQGDVVRVNASGVWVKTSPLWDASELVSAVRARLAPAPTQADTGKVPVVNAQGSGYALKSLEANSQVGIAGLRIETIEFNAVITGTTDVEMTPISTDPIVVEHGEGDPELITGLTGNDFTVPPGLYLLKIEGEIDGSQVGRIGFDIRDAADNTVIAGPNESSTYNTDGAYHAFSAAGYWHATEEIEVNFFMERYGRSNAVRNVRMRLALLNAEAQNDTVEHRETLPSADGIRDDKILLSDGRLWQKGTVQTADTFEGRLDHYSYGGRSYDGTSGSLGQTGSHGQFTVNPAGALAAVVNDRSVGLFIIEVRKDAYEAAKGSAVGANDEIKAVLTIGNSSETHTLVNIATYPNSDRPDTIRFRSTVASLLLRNSTIGTAWSMVITKTDDSALYTHAAAAGYWVEYHLDLEAQLHAAIHASHEELDAAIEKEKNARIAAETRKRRYLCVAEVRVHSTSRGFVSWSAAQGSGATITAGGTDTGGGLSEVYIAYPGSQERLTTAFWLDLRQDTSSGATQHATEAAAKARPRIAVGGFRWDPTLTHTAEMAWSHDTVNAVFEFVAEAGEDPKIKIKSLNGSFNGFEDLYLNIYADELVAP